MRPGQQVKVTVFGSDFGKVGKVLTVSCGWIYVELEGIEDKFQPNELLAL